jgi:hypothetical protein
MALAKYAKPGVEYRHHPMRSGNENEKRFSHRGEGKLNIISARQAAPNKQIATWHFVLGE